MKLDKSIGRWSKNSNKLSYLNNLSYHLYCQYRCNRNDEDISPQAGVLIHKKVYKKFYDEAELIIRGEKLKKLLDGIK